MIKLPRPTPAELNQMSHAEKDALFTRVFDLLESMAKRLEELEGRVEKNSSNSGKPPSSDGLKRQAAEPREAGSRRNGGL
jgi:transposase